MHFLLVISLVTKLKTQGIYSGEERKADGSAVFFDIDEEAYATICSSR